MKKKKYQVGGDDSSSFFNQLASMYASQFQDPSYGGGEDDGSEYVLPEELNGEPADYNSDNSDYEDLLSKYNDLQDQFSQFSQNQAGLLNDSFKDDQFLNFLFSGEDNSNLPINPDVLNTPKQTQTSSGINPYVTQTDKDIRTKYGLTNMGIWGDKAHQQRESDHNTGDAEDFGVNDPTSAQSAVNQLQNEASQRNIKYIIYNRKIWNPSISNEWRPYNGASPHTDHIHVSYNRKYGGKYQVGGTNYLNTSNTPKYQNISQIDKADQFGVDFSLRHNNVDPLNAHTGKKIGDPVMQFMDLSTGQPYDDRYGHMPKSMIKPLPDWVTELQWDHNWNMPYYLDGDTMNYVDKHWYNSPKFIKPQAQQDQIIASRQMGGYVNIDSTLNANRNIPFVDRIINANKYPVHNNPDGTHSTHLMGYADNFAFPTLRYVNGKWIENVSPQDAISAGDYIRFQTPEQAAYFSENYKKSKLSTIKQMGGVASTPAQQYQGLNDSKYNKLLFPMQGFNTFRGLDNGRPVLVEDMLGNKSVLKGKYDTSQFFGTVKEHRL